MSAGREHLRIVPVKFADACGFVATWHRHHQPPIGHRFSLGVVTPDDQLVGVAIVGRPVARAYDDGMTLEVTRSATDGTPNANSALYGATWRAAKALGYRRLVTYTQAGETGPSLRAAGWRVVAERPARPGWNMPSRPREDRGVDHMPRTLWEAGVMSADTDNSREHAVLPLSRDSENAYLGQCWCQDRGDAWPCRAALDGSTPATTAVPSRQDPRPLPPLSPPTATPRRSPR